MKAIWLEEDDIGKYNENESCCICCFNDPDNGIEDSPIGSSEWYMTNYKWEPIIVSDLKAGKDSQIPDIRSEGTL